MKLPQPKTIKWNYLALAFALPCLAMLAVMLICQFEPFGQSAILYSDMYHQYFPFFVAFRKALLSGESLLWNWSVGLGMDYLGLIAYYLGSPLNLLSVLMPESILLECFSLLLPIRLGLAGLFFAIFLKEIFDRYDISIAVFGAFYALCSWALGYLWNIMWLDTFALLPLVALGTVKLLRDKKFILYTVTLFFAVFCNYYIGFFVCIFVFLLFFIYEFCRWQGFRRFFQDLVRIALFSVLAIGMTAILELPAFAALQTTQSSVNKFPEGFKMNIAKENTWKGLLDAMRQVAGNMAGGVSPTFKEGLPNVYSGVVTLFLSFLYLLNKDVKWKDKVCAVVLLVFFMLSFILRQLDYIWHGFHFTNMIPYRFSFLFSFVMLVMAYRAWIDRERFRIWQVAAAALFASAIIACNNLARDLSLFEGSDTKDSWMFLLYNGTILIASVATFCYGLSEKKIPEDADRSVAAWIRNENALRRSSIGFIMVAVMAAELVLSLLNFGINFSGTSVTHYPRGTEHAASMIRYMHEREEDTLFYRAETTHSQTLNDGALNDYNGVTAFTSSANVKVTEFMRMLGYGAKNTYNRYCYEEASPVSDMFLNLKYMIERSGKSRGSSVFTQIHRYGDVALLQNNFYLPLGFLAEPELADVDFSGDHNGFRFQNVLMKKATGMDEDLWRIVTEEEREVIAVDVHVVDTTPAGKTTYSDGTKGATITYTYTAMSDGFMCLELDFPKRNDVALWKNGEALYTESMSLKQMMAVGDVVAGDVVEVRATCKNANESGTIDISAAILNVERLAKAYEIFSASTLELTKFGNTRIKGTINCNRDGLLYTSIPQNGNWTVEVDGEEAEVVLTGDVMVGVMLTQGEHQVEFRYRNKAFAWGWKISLLSAAAFGALVYMEMKKRPHGGKYKKEKR